MPTKHIEEVASITLSAIKTMGAVTGPCVSILLPVEAKEQAPQNAIRWKHAIETADEALTAKGVERNQREKMIESLRTAVEALPAAGKGLALYCAPELCEAFQTLQPLTEQVLVGDHFYIKPLIPLLHSDRAFYILALSQKHTRLLKCTEQNFEEVVLPERTPSSLWQDSQSEKPDHKEATHSSGGPDQGGMKGVSSSTNTDSERRMEYLSHFYKHLSEGVTNLLREENAPVVIAGVEYEIAAYRRVNTYPNLVEDAVHGAADGLKGGEMHKRALEAMRAHNELPLKAALGRYEKMAGGERGSSTVKEIVKAAFEGRILDLIVAEGAQYMGTFNEMKQSVKAHGDEDLLNVAALQTILHAGSVYVVPAAQVPNGARAVAVFRY